MSRPHLRIPSPALAALLFVGLAGCGTTPAAAPQEPPTPLADPRASSEGTPDAGAGVGFELDAGTSATRDGGTDGALRPPIEAFEAKVSRLMDRARVPGLSVAAVRGGGAIWQGAYGVADTTTFRPVRAGTRFVAASVSKTLLAVEILRLVEKGQLGLEDDVRPLLPYALAHRAFPDAPITVRQLLTHTSSLRDTWTTLFAVKTVDGDSQIKAVDFHRDYFTPGERFFADSNFGDATPGTTWEYSNVAFGVLADVVEKKVGKPYWEQCKDDLLAPLGMGDAAYFVTQVPASELALPHVWKGSSYFQPGTQSYPDYAVGMLYASATSLGRFVGALIEASPTGRALSPSMLDEALRVQNPSASQSQGLGFMRLSLARKGIVWGHTGSLDGSGAVIGLDPIGGVGVALLANGDVFGSDTARVEALAEATDLLFDVASSL